MFCHQNFNSNKNEICSQEQKKMGEKLVTIPGCAPINGAFSLYIYIYII